MTENANANPPARKDEEAAQHVAEAHRILSGLRGRLDEHPDLEKAISSLELALSILTTKTAGML